MSQIVTTPAEKLPRILAQRFISRPDVKAVQFEDGGGYRPMRGKPFTYRDLEEHIRGDRTYGHYMVGTDGSCKLGAFDLDVSKGSIDLDLLDGSRATITPRDVMADVEHPARPTCIHLLRTVAAGLEALSRRLIPVATVATAFSGNKGLHVYVLMPKPVDAEVIRKLLREVLSRLSPTWEPRRGDNFWFTPSGIYPGIEIEYYPKQDKVTDLGNLMRLPLGCHRATSLPGFFIDQEAPVGELVPTDPVKALT